MRSFQHQFGVDSQDPNTTMVFEANTILVPDAVMAKKIAKSKRKPEVAGKYPNGLAEALAQRNMTQAALAEKIGTSQQQIGKLVKGEREMTAIWAERIGPEVGWAPERLIFPSLTSVRAPVISWVTAGRMHQQDGVRRSDVKKYMFADLPKGDWIVLEVEGDSMNLVAPDGAFIFVNQADQSLRSDRFYVISTPEGETTFKRYIEDHHGERFQPFSTNPNHPTIFPDRELTIVGRVGLVINDLR